MKKFKVLFFTLTVASLGACKEFDGVLSLNDTTLVRDNKDQAQLLNAGSYTASIGSKNRKTGRISIKNGRDSVDFDFALPPEIKDKNYVGPFRLNANDIEQDFDISGSIAVRSTTSGPHRRSTSCVYSSYQERVCRFECLDYGHGRGGRGGRGGSHRIAEGNHYEINPLDETTLGHRSCRPVCYYQTRYVYGRRNEEYNITTRERVCEFQLADKYTRNVLGSFRGSQESSSRETILRRGRCRL